jgi:hypothetical protein
MNRQPKPDRKSYQDLISEIEKGQIKIPKFQRDFVWSKENTAKLLDSIIKGYPIGTFIMWETNERLNDIKNIGNISLPQIPDGVKVQYVLDGQQRITSLYAAFVGAKIQKEGEKKITDYKDIFVRLDLDLDNHDEQIIVSEKPDSPSIALCDLLDLNRKMLEIQSEYSKEEFILIHKFNQIFSTYEFSTIVLLKDDIESAIEVFTRINTGGQTLTLFEIMSAKSFDEKSGFDMSEKFKSFIDELSRCKYNTISSSVPLNLLSIVLTPNKECKRKNILQLNKTEIIDAWEDVITAIKYSIDFFRSVYRIPVSSLLPYDSLLIPFSYFFYVTNDKPKGDQLRYLEEFFWRVSLSYRYGSSTESKLAQDIKRIDEIIAGKRPDYDDYKVYLSNPKTLIDTSFSAGSSYCKAILCLYCYFEPKDFQDNGKVILDNSWLKLANSKNYHHIFPKSFLKKTNQYNENSIVNISLVGAELNKNKIRAKAPSIYFNDFNDENVSLKLTLKSHLINGIDEFGLSSDDYSVFLQKRSEWIYQELQNRIELSNSLTDESNSLKELVLAGESDRLEFKSTLRFDIKLFTLNLKLEYVIAKTIAAFLNAAGGILMIGINDHGDVIGLTRDFETFGSDKQNIDGFELQLRSIIKKYLGGTFEKYLSVTFPNLDGNTICMISIQSSGKPVFVMNEGREEFYVRIGNSSIPKNRQEQSEYERLHWK